MVIAASDANLTAHILDFKWSHTPNFDDSTIVPFLNYKKCTLMSIPEGSLVLADLTLPSNSLTLNPKIKIVRT